MSLYMYIHTYLYIYTYTYIQYIPIISPLNPITHENDAIRIAFKKSPVRQKSSVRSVRGRTWRIWLRGSAGLQLCAALLQHSTDADGMMGMIGDDRGWSGMMGWCPELWTKVAGRMQNTLGIDGILWSRDIESGHGDQNRRASKS